MDENLKQKLDAREGIYASPWQTLNIILLSPVWLMPLPLHHAHTRPRQVECNDWKGDKSKHNLWRSTVLLVNLTAMIREDVHNFWVGRPLYLRRISQALGSAWHM
jgi:hypothetical protein